MTDHCTTGRDLTARLGQERSLEGPDQMLAGVEGQVISLPLTNHATAQLLNIAFLSVVHVACSIEKRLRQCVFFIPELGMDC